MKIRKGRVGLIFVNVIFTHERRDDRTEIRDYNRQSVTAKQISRRDRFSPSAGELEKNKAEAGRRETSE